MKKKIVAQRQVGDYEVRSEYSQLPASSYFFTTAEKNRPKINRRNREKRFVSWSFSEYRETAVMSTFIWPDKMVYFEKRPLEQVLEEFKHCMPKEVFDLFESQVLLMVMQYGKPESGGY